MFPIAAFLNEGLARPNELFIMLDFLFALVDTDGKLLWD
jgi:hypothetical protein